MKAAVVTDVSKAPTYADFPAPRPQPGELLVTVRASALSQLVRAQASGRHYTSPKPPFAPGADGVGVLENGQRVYFAFPRNPVGAMAEQVCVQADCVVPLPDGIDDITAAAIANPGMSSWAALTERAQLQQGEGVLINGANGASGRLAIRIARHLGAGRIVVTARNTAAEADLRALGADVFIALGQEPDALQAALRAEIDKGIGVVLDYVWGSSAETIMQAATSHAPGEAAQRIRFVNIGSLGGLNINLPAGLLRSTGLELMGSGLSSVSNADLVRCIGEMFKVMRHIGLEIDAVGRPLTEVEQVWANSQDRSRVVFTL
ncbi:alcohol dehydrogenase [Halopseudomonas pachastrellae]|uniref:Alcohol dehydrogenase n=1 Tax=Halopseudomonas pachastrellae TaxID=254161 RepID=A0A1S8DCG9_9GAMM|nr:zinc-binding alcohol dehydrogenase family protein [Halopseudomonas pachastrellae]ONM43093.1 alcohol dehydrogenase [Halopseudomonas pachastrellae]SFM30357.1 NADPH:quinone reductase [Halopseudomonas pachastrellae]